MTARHRLISIHSRGEGWLAEGWPRTVIPRSARNRTYYTSFKTAKNGRRRLKGLPEDLVIRNNSARPFFRAALSSLDGGANANKAVHLNKVATRERFADSLESSLCRGSAARWTLMKLISIRYRVLSRAATSSARNFVNADSSR